MKLADTLRKAKCKEGEPMRVWMVDPTILLLPQIPKALHGVAPRVVLGENWWNKTRQAAYRSTNFHCQACGVSKYKAKYHQWLEGHEVYRIAYLSGRMTYLRTIPLCHFCHNAIHVGRLQALLERGEVHHAKFVAIIQHRDRLLKEAGIELLDPYTGPCAAWGKWRLIIEGKQYKPLYKTYESWLAAHPLTPMR